jgi:hypothetical protein
MMKLTLKRLSLAIAGAGLLTIYGCGGGNGTTADPVAPSTTLSGTAAGGAAIIGTVLVTDSKGATKGGTIEANGSYSIDVSGMTGPFVLKAAGTVGNTRVTYYSAATTADIGGTVNITPFTNLIVSNIAAQIAETYFSNPDNIAKIGTLITPDKLAAAETALQAKLQLVLTAMGISDSIDLLRSSFAANHSGMDAVLDLVKVEADTTTNIFTLKNALTQLAIATDDASKPTDDAIAVDSTKITGITPTTATDLQAIVAKLNSLAALFATGLPTLDQLTASGVFDTSSSFMMSGQSFAQFASELSTEPEVIGLKFSNVDIALDASLMSGTLTALITSNTSTFSEKIELKMVKLDGVWKVQGDDRIADVSINARAQLNANSGSSASIQNGIHIWIDPHDYNGTAATPVAKALITGPGLGNGVTLVPDVQNTWFKLEGSAYSNNLIPECTSSGATQCVTIAAALDNSQYTVVLKDGNGNILNGAGYKLTLPKQPYATNTLTAAMFPSITAVTIDGQAITQSTLESALATGGKSVNVSWTMPTGLLPEYLSIWANTSNGYFHEEKSLLPTATSALMSLGGSMSNVTVSYAGVWLEGVDTFGRSLAITK